MKKILIFAFMLSLFIAPMGGNMVFAEPGSATVWQDGASVPAITIESAVDTLFTTAFWLLVTLSTLFFLLGAFYFLTAGENADNLEKGKKVITFAVIGLVLAFLSWGITSFITGLF